MIVDQTWNTVNEATKQHAGEIAVLNKDLTNTVDFGDSVINVMGYDNYVKSLSDVIGKEKFVERKYSHLVPSVLKEKWEYGSILRKISGKIPEAQENETWKLRDGQSYPQDIFHQPAASQKLWNSKTTFMIPLSITRRQIKESFKSGDDLAAFISMLYNNVEISQIDKEDGLTLDLIAAFAGAIINNAGANVIHLITEYNTLFNQNVAITDAPYDAEFLRYMFSRIKNVSGYMRRGSTIWNEGAEYRFTPSEKMHCVMLSLLKDNLGVYLYDANGQFNTSNLQLENVDSVPYWQGSGTGANAYNINEMSKIDITTSEGTTTKVGVACVLFDHDAIAICNEDKYVETTPYNAVASFYTDLFKFDCSYFVDTNENGAVFLLD